MKQNLLPTWSWCHDVNIKVAAESVGCSEIAAREHCSQCCTVCFITLDDRMLCPEAGLMGDPGQLVQIKQCSVKAK